MMYTLAQTSQPPLALAWWVVVGGWVVSIILAIIGQGIVTRRAVNKHGDQEMGAVDNLADKVEQMAQLQEQHNRFAERRLLLAESRIDRLESAVYQV